MFRFTLSKDQNLESPGAGTSAVPCTAEFLVYCQIRQLTTRRQHQSTDGRYLTYMQLSNYDHKKLYIKDINVTAG